MAKKSASKKVTGRTKPAKSAGDGSAPGAPSAQSQRSAPRARKAPSARADRAAVSKSAAAAPGAKPYGARSDYGAPTDAWFEAIPDQTIRNLAVQLRDTVRTAMPKASEAIKWGVPVWEQDGPVCAVAATKKCAKLQFFDAGTSLDDPKGRLEGTGKGCRHVKVHTPAEFDAKAFTNLVKQAAAWNRAKREM